MAEWVDAVDAMRGALSRALPPALTAGAKVVAAYAKANHPYTNRTFRLQTHTEWQFTDGSLQSGYVIQVHGGMPYGSFVEEGTSRNRPYPYLRPAWLAMGQTMAEIVAASMVGAVQNVQ